MHCNGQGLAQELSSLVCRQEIENVATNREISTASNLSDFQLLSISLLSGKRLLLKVMQGDLN